MRIIFLIIAYIFVFCPKCFAESISDSEIVASSYLIKRNDMAVFSLSGKKPANWTEKILSFGPGHPFRLETSNEDY